MFLAVDFDGTIVKMDHPYDDLETGLQFMEGAEAALRALKAAGHVLLLWSARASPSLLIDPRLDPLVRAGVRKVHRRSWEESRVLNRARYQQMVNFVDMMLPDVFAAIDDGKGGKPHVDFFIDDRAVRFAAGGWPAIARVYGQLDQGAPPRLRSTNG